MTSNKAVFRSLLKDVPAELIRWKPSPEKWSLLEVICHLVDEEKEDFRTRLRQTLKDPEQRFPKIDPPGWVKTRKYHRQDYKKKLREFMAERDRSIRWLKQLRSPAWKNAHHHPKFGELSAEMFLANWLAHDHLHMRQIIRLKYEYLHSKEKVRFDYAGNW